MPRLIPAIALLAVSLLVLIGLSTTADEPPSPAEESIRQALNGELPRGGTGDGVLDDVIGLIEQRGSLLDGSALDPDFKAGRAASADQRTTVRSEKARVAEQLLKASRLLEPLALDDTERGKLVQQMRDEAGKLLTE